MTPEPLTAEDAYYEAQAGPVDPAEAAHYEAQEAADANCLVVAFHDDPITRSASLDEGEERPMVDAARKACAERGCPNCNRTVGCYVCTREAGGDPFAADDTHPQRRVVSERTVNPADPTTALTLECGHTII